MYKFYLYAIFTISTLQASDVTVTMNSQDHCTKMQHSISKEEALIYIEETIALKIYDLLNTGNINAQDENGCTALIYATAIGNKELIRDLLKHGADPMLATHFGTTVFMIAQDSEREDLIEILLHDWANPQEN